MKKAIIYSDFIQQIPVLENEFTDDIFIQDYLKTYFPTEQLNAILPDLEHFGKRVANEFLEWANDAQLHEPMLTQYNAFGQRVDEIKIAQGWKNLNDAAAEEGLVAIGYERKFGAYSRLYQFVKLYLFTPSSAIYTCPLAMTDGAARLIEVYGDDDLKSTAFQSIISRNPSTFKTSGQWMTERTGGSDVSRSMTFAEETTNGFVLKGHKWFTSAITADMAFTLASTEPATENKRAPLSLFYLPIRQEDGKLNGIEVEALKDKLGTRALPTAQLQLTGAKAKLVGEKGKGVRTISTLFNITRIYNTISAVSYMRRAYSLSEKYGKQREAFGKELQEHVLHQKTIRTLEIAYQSGTLFALFLARLLGKEDCNIASENEKSLLRVLTPIAKLYTAKQSIKSASEHIEVFGGIGYLEDSGIPVMLRDTQVLSIWEGTTNVLSLDMLRAIEKENGLQAWHTFATEIINQCNAEKLKIHKEKLKEKILFILDFIQQKQHANLVAYSKDIAFYIAETSIALLWLDFLSTNINKENYLNSFEYWIHYKMNEKDLTTIEILDLI